jgi:tetratricopeptide (TPR) repeat protein
MKRVRPMHRSRWALAVALAAGIPAAHADTTVPAGAPRPAAPAATAATAAPPGSAALAAPVAPSAPAASAAPPPASGPAAAPPEAVLVAPADADQRIDSGLEALAAKRYEDAARALYGVYLKLPLGDSRRDLAGYHLATALEGRGFTQAAAEHLMEILSGRRSPEFTDPVLVALKALYEKRLVDEERFVDGVLYGGQFTNVSPDVADFVEYLQALTDVRHGFATWGRARLETLARAGRPYSWSARYALAVERIARHDDDAAIKELRAIIASSSDMPFEVKNQARVALGRALYERKLYDEAWAVYSRVDSPLPLQDVVMVERAWDRVAGGDQQRALGLLVGLGAPVFHAVFAPERYLIRGLAFRRICQYREAHLAVREFRSKYGPQLEKIRSRAFVDDPTIRSWAVAGTPSLRGHGRIQDVLTLEMSAVTTVGDKALRDHLDAIYRSGIDAANRAIDRELEEATGRVADELLRIDEQMNIVDYEIGAGLFKSGQGKTAGAARSPEVPLGSDEVYFKFDGEYWSDELGDYSVLAEDRCVR